MGVRLPVEYQEVEYIQTSQIGAPYINSGVAITEDLVFEIDFQLTNSAKAKYFMGTYNGNDFFLYLSGDSTSYFQTAFGAGWQNTTLLADTQRHKFVYHFENGNLVVKDSNTTILTKAKGSFSERPILVAGTSQASRSPCRTYESKMTKSGVVIQDLIPCYRKADDTPGMYDIVSNTFFTNAGTGEFLVGPDVIGSISPLMVAWRRMLMREPSPIPTGYVTDGLLLWLDAKCNTRQGFNQAPEYWEDLSGNERDYYLRPEAKASFVNNAIYFEPGVAHNSIETSKPFTGDEISVVRTEEGSVELIADPSFEKGFEFILGFGAGYPQITADISNSNLITFDVQSQTKFSLIAQSGTHYYNSSNMVDGVVQSPVIYSTTWNNNRPSSLFAYGSADTQYCYTGRFSVLRIYNRKLTDAELMQNWLRDKARYNL